MYSLNKHDSRRIYEPLTFMYPCERGSGHRLYEDKTSVHESIQSRTPSKYNQFLQQSFVYIQINVIKTTMCLYIQIFIIIDFRNDYDMSLDSILFYDQNIVKLSVKSFCLNIFLDILQNVLWGNRQKEYKLIESN